MLGIDKKMQKNLNLLQSLEFWAPEASGSCLQCWDVVFCVGKLCHSHAFDLFQVIWCCSMSVP